MGPSKSLTDSGVADMDGRDMNYKWGLEITTNQRVYTVSVSDIPNCWHVSDRTKGMASTADSGETKT
jgi:hypothetical protein